MANPENGLEWFSKRLIETLPAAVCVCNADAVIVAFNKRATELWGRSPRPGQTHEKYCGSHKLFWPDGTYLPPDQTSMEWVLRNGKPWRDQEAIIERPDGSRVTVLINIDPVFDDNGKQIGAEQEFLKAMLQRADATGVLSNPVRLDQFVRAVAGAMTVDTGGYSLLDLAFGLRGISPQSITGIRIPSSLATVGDQSYVVASPDAAGLFAALRQDTLDTWASQNKQWVNSI